jgi:hypothetical protein
MHVVRLELARCREFPEGSKTHGYALRLPLDTEGRLSSGNWARQRHDAGFTRFWGEDTERGRLVHGRHGWGLAFDDDDEVEPIFRSTDHRFSAGEYISITERDGMTRTFRVVSVLPH